MKLCEGVFGALRRGVFAAVLVAALTAGAEETPVGTALVIDPGAPGGVCTAVRITDESGRVVLPIVWTNALPGVYRVSLPLRVLTPPDSSFPSVRMNVSFGGSNTAWLSFPISRAQMDGAPEVWTRLTHTVTRLDPLPGKDRLKIAWNYNLEKEEGKPVKVVGPERPDTAGSFTEAGPDTDELTLGMIEQLKADVPRPLSEIQYPALLVGTPVVEAVVTTLAVEKVWPDYVHVYPGGSNPVAVTVRNFTDQKAEARVRLEMRTGLDETAGVGEEAIQVPAHGAVTAVFPWTAGAREYGHEAVATVSVAGRPVHSRSEYFSVGVPVWKTAIQGDGFLTWYGREPYLADHVDENRRAYINVEEAFSWQPSSWTDLNPTTADWWTGQGGAHNSRAGLMEWMARSHSNGIKMITYSWASASGKSGFDLGRRFPDILCREKMGVAPNIDLEDLRLQGITQSRPELWRYQSANWLNNFINLGLLRAIQHHASEVIQSSRTFGWDGIRFDYPPSWSEMGTADVHREFEIMGVQDLMKQLMPEEYASTNSAWSSVAIGKRNVRYFRHVFTRELGAQFAMSYNGGSLTRIDTNAVKMAWFREQCQAGGQIMNEAIRTMGSISNYVEVAWWHAETCRQAGGYSCLFQAERCSAPLASVYSAIFTFASGSHPYLNYGWLGAKPGMYSRFMTRYGEYCWDLALAPVSAEAAGLAVESRNPLLWERYIRQRQTGPVLQTVMHLIARPEFDHVKAETQSQVPWSCDVGVRKKCRAEPEVWFLTAEPNMTAIRLPVERCGEGVYAVKAPSVRFWSMLVWSEKQ